MAASRLHKTDDGRCIHLFPDDVVIERDGKAWILRIAVPDVVCVYPPEDRLGLRWVYRNDPMQPEPFRYMGILYQDTRDRWHAQRDREAPVRCRDQDAAVNFLAFGDDPQ